MSIDFNGKIHRHTKDAGEILRARITTPSKKVTVFQDCKVKVKASELSDLDAVIKDMNLIMTDLSSQETAITALVGNITSHMPAIGQYGSAIKYTFDASLNEYINSDGIIKKRPPYGGNTMTGSLYINVSKGHASLDNSIEIGILPYTIDEVEEEIKSAITWDKIKGMNWQETQLDATSGKSNVFSALKLPKIYKSVYAEQDVEIEWTYTDTLASLFSTERIKIEDDPDNENYYVANIERKPYSEIYGLYKTRVDVGDANVNTYFKSVVRNFEKSKNPFASTSTVEGIYMQISGLEIVGNLKVKNTVSSNIDTSKTTNKFVLKTLSLGVTNSEVSEYINDVLQDKITLEDEYIGRKYTLKDSADAAASGHKLPIYVDRYVTGTLESDLQYASVVKASIESFTLKDMCPDFFPNIDPTAPIMTTTTSFSLIQFVTVRGDDKSVDYSNAILLNGTYSQDLSLGVPNYAVFAVPETPTGDFFSSVGSQFDIFIKLSFDVNKFTTTTYSNGNSSFEWAFTLVDNKNGIGVAPATPTPNPSTEGAGDESSTPPATT